MVPSQASYIKEIFRKAGKCSLDSLIMVQVPNSYPFLGHKQNNSVVPARVDQQGD